MSAKTEFCNCHVNGFEHIEAASFGLDAEKFDLGIKFEEQESNEYVVSPEGIKAWAEPYLCLYVSVGIKVRTEKPTLRYCLTRSKWNQAVKSSEADRTRLLELSRSQICQDVVALEAGSAPIAAERAVYL